MAENYLKAETPFNEYTGTCAIDESEEVEFLEFAARHGVDLQRFLPVAFGAYKDAESETVYVYVVDRGKVAASYDEIQAYLAGTGGQLPVRKIDLQVTLSQSFAFMKRFSLVVPLDESLKTVAIKRDEGFVFWE